MSRSLEALLWGIAVGLSLSVPALADVMESAPGDAAAGVLLPQEPARATPAPVTPAAP